MGGTRLTLAKLVHQEQWLSGFILFYFSILCLSSDDLSRKHGYNLEFQGRGVLAWNGEQVDQIMAMQALAYQCGVWCCSLSTSCHLFSSCGILGGCHYFLALVASLHSAPHLFPVCMCMCVCACACVHCICARMPTRFCGRIFWSLHSKVKNLKQAYPWPHPPNCVLISPVTKSNRQRSNALGLFQTESESWANCLAGRKRSGVWASLGAQSCFQCRHRQWVRPRGSNHPVCS